MSDCNHIDTLIRPSFESTRRYQYRPPFVPLVNHTDKKPDKCPVCAGNGNKTNPEKTQVVPCNACDGKGVVWG